MKLSRHYSGPKSTTFWRAVNREVTDGMSPYLAAILLQEMEERVLGWLEQARAPKRRAIRRKR